MDPLGKVFKMAGWEGNGWKVHGSPWMRLLQGWDLHRVSFLGCRLLWGCEHQEEKKPPLSRRAVLMVLPLPLGLTRRQKSAGMAPALGMGAKNWKTPPRNEKPALWVMLSSECRERAGRKNYTSWLFHFLSLCLVSSATSPQSTPTPGRWLPTGNK